MNNKNEKRINPDVIEGRNPVIEALKAGRTINKIQISKGEKSGSILEIIKRAKEKKIVLQEVDKEVLSRSANTSAHQNVIAYVTAKEYVEVEDIIEYAIKKNELPFILILDGIEDAHNLGSLIRTAEAVGVHGVIIPKRRAVAVNSIVCKAAAGAVEYMKIARVTNITNTIELLKKENIWVFGTDLLGETSLLKADLKGPIAIVIGGEGKGIGRLVKEACDLVISIPMNGKISSFNASVAGAITMYEVLKQRKGI